MALGCGIPLFAAEQSANFRQRRQGRRFAGRNHLRGLAEIVPRKRFHVRLNDYVRLRAPGEIAMPLDDVEGAAEDVRERARLLDVVRFQVDGDDHVRAKKQNIEQPRTFTDVLSRSFNIIQRHSDLSWRTQADIVIEPDVKPFAWDDFSKTPEMIAAGEAATLAALPEIRALLCGEKRDSAA